MTDAQHDDAELVAQVLSLADVFSGRAYNADPWSVSTEPTAALLRQAAERISALSSENARLADEVAKLSKPEWYFDDQDGENSSSDINSLIDDMDMNGVMRVGGARQVWRAWVAHKCLTVDSDGEPDEMDYETFDTPEEAEKCWPESLAKARAALNDKGSDNG